MAFDFNKENIAKNLTLFLYPDDSDKAGHLLRIYQQYFMVCCGAKLILKELKEQNFELTSLPEHVVIQINDTHPSMIIPELIRLLMEQGIDFDTATDPSYPEHVPIQITRFWQKLWKNGRSII